MWNQPCISGHSTRTLVSGPSWYLTWLALRAESLVRRSQVSSLNASFEPAACDPLLLRVVSGRCCSLLLDTYGSSCTQELFEPQGRANKCWWSKACRKGPCTSFFLGRELRRGACSAASFGGGCGACPFRRCARSVSMPTDY